MSHLPALPVLSQARPIFRAIPSAASFGAFALAALVACGGRSNTSLGPGDGGADANGVGGDDSSGFGGAGGAPTTTNSTGGAPTGPSTVTTSGGMTTTSGGMTTTSGGMTTTSGGMTTTSGGMTTTSGGMTTTSGGMTTASTGGMTTASTGGMTTASTGGMTATSTGGMTATSTGGMTATSGGMTTASTGGGNPLDCLGCALQNCPDALDCLTDQKCVQGVSCAMQSCIGMGGPDITCILKCFNGDFGLALKAFNAVTCVTQKCSNDCQGLGP